MSGRGQLPAVKKIDQRPSDEIDDMPGNEQRKWTFAVNYLLTRCELNRELNEFVKRTPDFAKLIGDRPRLFGLVL